LKHHASDRFWRSYDTLPAHVQIADGDDLVWFWIGSHADYEKLLQ